MPKVKITNIVHRMSSKDYFCIVCSQPRSKHNRKTHKATVHRFCDVCQTEVNRYFHNCVPIQVDMAAKDNDLPAAPIAVVEHPTEERVCICQVFDIIGHRFNTLANSEQFLVNCHDETQ